MKDAAALLATLAAWVATVIVGALLFVAWFYQPAKADPINPVRTEYMPCATEDGDAEYDCVWDARHMGNGLGFSFYVGTAGKTYVLPHHIAHHLLNHP